MPPPLAVAVPGPLPLEPAPGGRALADLVLEAVVVEPHLAAGDGQPDRDGRELDVHAAQFGAADDSQLPRRTNEGEADVRSAPEVRQRGHPRFHDREGGVAGEIEVGALAGPHAPADRHRESGADQVQRFEAERPRLQREPGRLPRPPGNLARLTSSRQLDLAPQVAQPRQRPAERGAAVGAGREREGQLGLEPREERHQIHARRGDLRLKRAAPGQRGHAARLQTQGQAQLPAPLFSVEGEPEAAVPDLELAEHGVGQRDVALQAGLRPLPRPPDPQDGGALAPGSGQGRDHGDVELHREDGEAVPAVRVDGPFGLDGDAAPARREPRNGELRALEGQRGPERFEPLRPDPELPHLDLTATLEGGRRPVEPGLKDDGAGDRPVLLRPGSQIFEPPPQIRPQRQVQVVPPGSPLAIGFRQPRLARQRGRGPGGTEPKRAGRHARGVGLQRPLDGIGAPAPEAHVPQAHLSREARPPERLAHASRHAEAAAEPLHLHGPEIRREIGDGGGEAERERLRLEIHRAAEGDATLPSGQGEALHPEHPPAGAGEQPSLGRALPVRQAELAARQIQAKREVSGVRSPAAPLSAPADPPHQPRRPAEDLEQLSQIHAGELGAPTPALLPRLEDAGAGERAAAGLGRQGDHLQPVRAEQHRGGREVHGNSRDAPVSQPQAPLEGPREPLPEELPSEGEPAAPSRLRHRNRRDQFLEGQLSRRGQLHARRPRGRQGHSRQRQCRASVVELELLHLDGVAAHTRAPLQAYPAQPPAAQAHLNRIHGHRGRGPLGARPREAAVESRGLEGDPGRGIPVPDGAPFDSDGEALGLPVPRELPHTGRDAREHRPELRAVLHRQLGVVDGDEPDAQLASEEREESQGDPDPVHAEQRPAARPVADRELLELDGPEPERQRHASQVDGKAELAREGSLDVGADLLARGARPDVEEAPAHEEDEEEDGGEKDDQPAAPHPKTALSAQRAATRWGRPPLRPRSGGALPRRRGRSPQSRSAGCPR